MEKGTYNKTVTPELALAAAAVLKLFCEQQILCEKCVLASYGFCETVPQSWEIPERKKDGDLQR